MTSSLESLHGAALLRAGSPARQACHRSCCVWLRAGFDLLALVAAYCIAFELRLALNPLMSLPFTRSELAAAAPPLGGILLLWVAAVLWLRVYRRSGSPSDRLQLGGALRSAVLSGTLAIVVTFFSRELGASLSRSFVLLFVPLSFALLVGARYGALAAGVLVHRKWPFPERVAVIGSGPEVRRLADQVREGGKTLVELVGVVLPAGAPGTGLGNPLAVLGTTAQLGELINRQRLDRVVIAHGCLTEQQVEQCSRIAQRMGVVLERPVSPIACAARLVFTERYGLQLVELQPVVRSRTQEVIKRALDIALSALALVVLSPVLVLFAVWIKLTSPGPVFYVAPRVGKGGRHFPFFKFRSMYCGLEERQGLREQNQKTGHLFKLREDPRVTPLGRFMRRFSIDELPQLLNVLRGEMSLVGPRPLPAQDLEADGMSRNFPAWAEQRARMLPGITGLWQIRGRSELPFEAMVEYDDAYLRHWSLLLDLRILLKTPLAVLGGRGAY
jgi:exopolysaccharide biosynthesis polyprenyl glycosylphosphotransferase